MSKRKYRGERLAFIGDVHCPYQDERAVKMVLKFLKDYKPTHLYLIGDIIDFYGLSRFDKSPDRITVLGEEIDETVELLDRIRKTCPRSKIFFQDGNHEARLDTWKCKHPEVAALKQLTVPALLELDKFNIKHTNYAGSWNHADMSINHGNVVRGKSGASAYGELEKRYSSGISGHTHRMAAIHTTRGGKQYSWYENGCLCETEPDYCTNPDWQQGFHVSSVIDGKTFTTPMPIRDHKMIYSGTVYSG